MSDQKQSTEQDKIDEQRAEMDALNMQIESAKFDLPMLKITENILMVPLVGTMDSVKSQKVMEDILNTIRQQDLRAVIVDIAGISVVDSSVALHLIKIAKATKLMGCKAIISGISPLIAQNIVNLGVNVGDLITTNTLSDAMKTAYNHLGLELVKKSD